MQLNVATDYALRVLIYAAVHRDARCQTTDVANAFGASRHHVVKVVNRLSAMGYLRTLRGRGGGFEIARDPADIRVGDVVRRTEGSLALVECFARATNTCPLTPACGLKGALREAFDAFFTSLDRWTVADLVAAPRWTAQVYKLGRPA